MAAVQLRIGFEEPTSPVTLFLSANGLRVNVECTSGTLNDAHAYLTSAGLSPEMSTGAGLSFPILDFVNLAHLDDKAIVLADATLRPLLSWVEHPSDESMAMELELGADSTLWMRWKSQGSVFIEPLSAASCAALLGADLPFVASNEAFEALRTTCHLPLMVGRCRTHRAGYVEIETSKPVLLEACELPGLFRIDDTHYGLPFAYISSLADRPGFLWEGPPPQLESGPVQLPPMPARLSEHAVADLRSLVDALAKYRSQVVAWDSGLGRRVFVLSALVALDAFPALVVCEPDRVWQWWRLARLFSRTVGVDNDGVDIRVLTYEEFVSNPSAAYSAQTLVFDDVTSSRAATPEVAAAAVSVGGMLDCYLIGITDALPEDPKQLVSVMSRLRPAEFQTDIALVDRYGDGIRERLQTHVAAYTSVRRRDDPGRDAALPQFNHTQVTALHAGRELAKELTDLPVMFPDPERRVAAEVQMVSSGSRFALSPKLATAVEMATTAVDAGHRVAVVTAHPRTSLLLNGLLRPHRPTVHTSAAGEPAPSVRLLLVCGMEYLPDLSWYDEVIVMDYPTSYAELDACVGDPRSTSSPLRVTLLHLAGSLDDKMAVFAARNDEQN